MAYSYGDEPIILHRQSEECSLIVQQDALRDVCIFQLSSHQRGETWGLRCANEFLQCANEFLQLASIPAVLRRISSELALVSGISAEEISSALETFIVLHPEHEIRFREGRHDFVDYHGYGISPLQRPWTEQQVSMRQPAWISDEDLQRTQEALGRSIRMRFDAYDGAMGVTTAAHAFNYNFNVTTAAHDINWDFTTFRRDPEADKRAEQLFMEHLSDEQKSQWEQSKSIECVGNKSGKTYKILNFSQGNVRCDGGKYCLVSKTSVPLPDQLLTQKMLIENDEERFLKVANKL